MKKLKLSKEDQHIDDKYTALGLGHPDFFRFWRVVRTQQYYDNKNNGRSDPFDVFDDYIGCRFTHLIPNAICEHCMYRAHDNGD